MTSQPLKLATSDIDDARTLRRATEVLLRRSRKPRSFLLRVLCRVLLDTATKIESGGLEPR